MAGRNRTPRRGGKGGGRRPSPEPSAPRRPVPDDALVVSGKSRHWLTQGFPWVYPDEVVGGDPGAPGSTRRLLATDGTVLGVGLTDRGRLAARVMRHDEGLLDEAWMHARVQAAWDLRRQAVLTDDTTCCRLLHGENDGVPGVRVDLWGEVATVVLDGPALAPLLDPLARALRSIVGVTSGFLCYRPDSRDEVDVSRFRPLPGRLWGELAEDAEIEVLEAGLPLGVRPGDGPDTGVYMDMRDVRAWLRPHLGGRRVVNLFSYTGAFSTAALAAGAAHVTTVDLSGPYLARAADNLARLEAIQPGVSDRHDLVEDDAFRALDRIRRSEAPVDVVICDPPSFSHGPAGTWSAVSDTPRLVAACARVLAPGGWLVFASNHGQTSPRKFRGAVHDGLRKAKREAVELTFLGTPPDFPAAVTFPEAHYLKVGVWRLA